MFAVRHGKAHGKKKATDGVGAKRRVMVFAVRRKKKLTHGNNWPLSWAVV
jgi:hypothetical protein